jgi:hypothetical protein
LLSRFSSFSDAFSLDALGVAVVGGAEAASVALEDSAVVVGEAVEVGLAVSAAETAVVLAASAVVVQVAEEPAAAGS